MGSNLLAADLGTSAVKAVLVSPNGEALGSGQAGYPIHHPAPGMAEQDPQEWWQAVVQAVHQALSAAASPESVAAIGLSGQMHGTVLLDKQKRLVAPAAIWPDQRTFPQVEEAYARTGREALIQRTGSPAAAGFQALTLLWYQQERPDLWRRVHKALLPKDYLRLRLTGELASDPSDACGTLLLDIHTRSWSSEILGSLGLDPGLLPPIQPSASLAGGLRPEAAGQLGLPAGIPVVTGAGDTPAALLGAGVLHPQTLLLNLSTGGQTALPLDRAGVDRSGRVHTFCTALEPGDGGAGWYLLGGTLSAGLSLRWLRDQVFGLQGDESAYERMSALAAQAPPGAGGLVFLPYLVGERTPHMDPQARGMFLGLTLQHGQAELVRAVMEGVVLACFEAYQVLLETGSLPDKLVLAGGGARSPVWRQIIADVFGLPVHRLVVADQSAMGAALLAGGGIGQFNPVEAAREWAYYDPPLEPEPRAHARYQEILPVFQHAYQAHREDFPRLKDLS
jgi:xylulokinase